MIHKEDASSIHIAMSSKHIIVTGLLSWLAMIGIDFFLHAGLLSKLYLTSSPFLLPPERAFRLIPLGYLSFLLLNILLIWLMIRLKTLGWLKGFVFGISLGGLTWGSFTLGLSSISTADSTLLVGWFLGQTFELGVGGAAVGYGLAGKSIKRLSIITILGIVILVLLTVILQTVGLAPSQRL